MKNYSKKYSLFFVHIPKNAGTSLNSVLEIPDKNRGHRTALELYQMYPEYRNTLSLAVVRNPWDRMVSLFEYRKKKRHIKHLEEDVSFEKWILDKRTPFYAGHMEWMNQSDIISTNGTSLVSNILRYEYLEEDYKELQNYFKTLPSLKKLNSTDRGDYQEYYTNISRDYVKTLFLKDIKTFGYEF